MKTLVVGGSGLVGSAIVRALHEDGHKVVALSRRSSPPAIAGVKHVAADVRDAAAVARIAHGCDAAVFAVAGTHGRYRDIEAEGAVNLARALAGSSSRRLVYVSGSSTGVAPDWFEAGQAKALAEKRLLDDERIAPVVLRPSWFMESLGRFVRGKTFSFFGKQPNPIHWLALKDFAEIVRHALSCDMVPRRAFPIYGPEALRLAEAGRRYADAHGLSGGVRSAPLWMGRLLGLTSSEIHDAVALLRVFERFGEADDVSESRSLFGSPKTNLDDWLTENAPVRG